MPAPTEKSFEIIVCREDDDRNGKISKFVVMNSLLSDGLLGFVRNLGFSYRGLAIAVLMLFSIIGANMAGDSWFSSLLLLVAFVVSLGWVFQNLGKVRTVGLIEDGKIIAGVRVRVNHFTNSVRIAGIYVNGDHRGERLYMPLLGGICELAESMMPDGDLIPYAPSHPVTRHIEKELFPHGRINIESSEFAELKARMRTH